MAARQYLFASAIPVAGKVRLASNWWRRVQISKFVVETNLDRQTNRLKWQKITSRTKTTFTLTRPIQVDQFTNINCSSYRKGLEQYYWLKKFWSKNFRLFIVWKNCLAKNTDRVVRLKSSQLPSWSTLRKTNNWQCDIDTIWKTVK